MFAEINPAYLVALLFFIVCGGYTGTVIAMFKGNPPSKSRRDYVVSGSCVLFASLFYGFMIISDNETLTQVLWSLGFASYILFYPTWIRFTSNMIAIKNRVLKRIVHGPILIILTAVFSVVCIFSNGVSFIETGYGNQLSHYGEPLFAVTAIYVLVLSIGVFAAHIKWWRESETKRQRRQQLTFVILTFMFAPVGFINDFILPAFTQSYIFPLLPILLFPASTQLLFSMRKNKTLSITVANVSQYVFSSTIIPTFVLDHTNEVRLLNDAAAEFFGRDIFGKNVAELIVIDGNAPEQSLFDESFSKGGLTIKAASGARVCDILFSVERDKHNDALCKVVMINDMTEVLKARELEVAERGNKARLDFLLGMSHEMMTPMNAIMGMTQIARRTRDPETVKDCLKEIDAASHELFELLKGLFEAADR